MNLLTTSSSLPTLGKLLPFSLSLFSFPRPSFHRRKLAFVLASSCALKSKLTSSLSLVFLVSFEPSYLLLISIGHLRDFFGKKFYPAYYKDLIPYDVSRSSIRVREFSIWEEEVGLSALWDGKSSRSAQWDKGGKRLIGER